MAWAIAETLEAVEAETRIITHRGPVFRPVDGAGGISLACPMPGSLASLVARHAAQALRFTPADNRGGLLFTQPPKPRFRQVIYGSPPHRTLFELRREGDFAPWPIRQAVALIEMLRDRAAARLLAVAPGSAAEITRLLIGRGATPADRALRPRLIPLPSIGAIHADHAIRRVLLEVPGLCPLPLEDLAWAFSGLILDSTHDPETGEILAETRLLRAEDEAMLRHFGINTAPVRRWRSVTPVALPNRPHAPSPRNGHARMTEAQDDATALHQAMRHAGLDTVPAITGIQREPYAARGARAEEFATGRRFTTQRLRHVELSFPTPTQGPLLFGDGRFLGLGLFAPVRDVHGINAFRITSGLEAARPDPEALARALRRAVMARTRDQLGAQRLPSFFSGHAEIDGPLREGGKAHLAFTFDPEALMLCVVAPHLLSARQPTVEEKQHLAVLGSALADFSELRAGMAGCLRLEADDAGATGLMGPARLWASATSYTVTRHEKRRTAAEMMMLDVVLECGRRGLPSPEVEVLSSAPGPRGVSGKIQLRFSTVQMGPLLLGRQAHLGGGLFCPVA